MKFRTEKGNNIKKLFIMLILVESIIAVFLLVKFNGKKETVNFTKNNLTAYAGEFLKDGSYYIDERSGFSEDNCLSSGPMALKWGVYRVNVHFDSQDEQVLKVEDPTLGYHALLCNAVSMRQNTRTDHTGVTALLLQNTKDLEVNIFYNGKGAMRIDSLTMVHTNQEYGMLLCVFLLVFALVDGGIWISFSRKNGKMSLQTAQVFYFLTVMSILVCMPLFIDYFQLADDVTFHITRIEGLVQSWQIGQFPSRMQPNWLEGMGYPVSIMYGDVFLWFSALLHMIGFDLMVSYKAGVAVMNVATVWISYFCFKNIFHDRKIGVWGTFLYTFSLYRLYNVYMRGAVGEYTAMTFLPVVAWALYGLLSADIKKAKEKKYIWLLAAGFTGLLLSHVLSFEFAGLFTIFTLLIFWRRTIRKETLTGIIKAALLAIAANLWFLIPFLDYTLHMNMVVLTRIDLIQNKGLFPVQLLSLVQWAGTHAYMYQHGMQDVRPFGMGAGMLIGGGAFLYFWIIKGKKTRKIKEINLGKACFIMGTVAAVLCLDFFPWDAIASSSKALTKVTSSIQFPYRLLVIVTLCYTLDGCVLLKEFIFQKNRRKVRIFAGVLIVATMLQALFFMDDLMQIKGYSSLRNIEALGSETVSGCEYLPADTDYRNYLFNTVVCGKNVSYQNYTRNNLTVHVQCENTGKTESYIDPTLLCYLGYHITDDATGKEMQMCEGTNGVMRVLLPAGYDGSLTIRFTGMWYWHISDGISLIVWLGIVCYGIACFWNRRAGKHLKKQKNPALR